jgi:hypothetical protein
MIVVGIFVATPALADPRLGDLMPRGGEVEMVVPTVPPSVLSSSNPKGAMVHYLAKMQFQTMDRGRLSVHKQGSKLIVSSNSSALGSLFAKGLVFDLKARVVLSPDFGQSRQGVYSPLKDILKLAGLWVPGYTFHFEKGHVHVGKVRSEKGKCLMAINLSDQSQFNFLYLKYSCGG